MRRPPFAIFAGVRTPFLKAGGLTLKFRSLQRLAIGLRQRNGKLLFDAGEVFGRHSRLGADLRLILLGRKQRGQFSRVAKLDFVKPAAGMRLAIHQRGIIHRRLIDFDDFSAHGGINIAGSLDGLNHCTGLAGLYMTPHVREFDKDDIREFMLGVVGDADGGGVTGNAHPFV